MTDYDLLILGGGPAGLTAGIYAGRALLKVAMLEKLVPGGQVAQTDWIENYPGFEDGVAGFDLVQKMDKQARRFGLEVMSAEVTDVDFSGAVKKVITGTKEYTAKAVIVTTGTDPKLLGIPGEKEFKGKGVSYCGTCDAPFFKDRDVIVVGGGSTSVQEALYLTKFAKSVKLISRRETMKELKAERILIDRALKEPKLEFVMHHRLTSINGNNKIESVTLEYIKTGEKREQKIDGVFIFIGYDPNTGFLKGKIDLDDWGYIKTDENMETSAKGVYAAGDVRAKNVKQITTAVGEGTVAAEHAIKLVESQED
ncbi:thioredoxin-disulfide reductase [candidate division KSB1 bacterium]|nr:MAG: thioredoxin-disulfide reductase [candidate division KSB1 bacterium]